MNASIRGTSAGTRKYRNPIFTYFFGNYGRILVQMEGYLTKRKPVIQTGMYEITVVKG
jgi:hypothetical protein